MNVEQELDFKSFRNKKTTTLLNEKLIKLCTFGAVSTLFLVMSYSVINQVSVPVFEYYKNQAQITVQHMDIVASPSVQETNKDIKEHYLNIYLEEEKEIFDKFNADESMEFDFSGADAAQQYYEAIIMIEQSGSYSVFKNLLISLFKIPQAREKLSTQQLNILKEKFEYKLNQQFVLSQKEFKRLNMDAQVLDLSTLKLEKIKAKEAQDMLELLYPHYTHESRN